jgi:hypothetical protein
MEDAASDCGTVAVRDPLPVGLLSTCCIQGLQSAVHSLSINASPSVPSEASALAALRARPRPRHRLLPWETPSPATSIFRIGHM